MKTRISSVLILTFIFCSTAFSQVLVGPVAGANFSWTSFSDKDLKDEYNVSPVFGYHVGGHLAFKVRKRFFLHSSLIYSTKGKNLKSEAGDLSLKLRYKYIEMPIVYTAYFKGHIGQKEFKYSLGVGPNVSYWLGGKGTFEKPESAFRRR